MADLSGQSLVGKKIDDSWTIEDPLQVQGQDSLIGKKIDNSWVIEGGSSQDPLTSALIGPDPDAAKARAALNKVDSGSSGITGAISDLGKGLYTGITRRVPELIGQAMQFSGIAPETGKAITDWAKEGEVEKPKGLFEQTGEMIPSSAGIPLALGTAGKLISMIPHPAAKIVGAGLNLATYLQPLIFGLSQAQQTRETAKEKGVEEGWAPYITGGIETAGETVANVALQRLLGPLAGVVRNAGTATMKDFARPTAKQFLKRLAVETIPTETATEFGQQFGEALTEKKAGIRPEANPWQEGVDVLAPTALMTILTGGPAHVAQRYGTNKILKKFAAPVEGYNPQEQNLSPEIRNKVQDRKAMADIMATMIEGDNSPEAKALADQWKDYAYGQIAQNLPVDVNKPVQDLKFEEAQGPGLKAQGEEGQNQPEGQDKVTPPLTEEEMGGVKVPGVVPKVEQGPESEIKGLPDLLFEWTRKQPSRILDSEKYSPEKVAEKFGISTDLAQTAINETKQRLIADVERKLGNLEKHPDVKNREQRGLEETASKPVKNYIKLKNQYAILTGGPYDNKNAEGLHGQVGGRQEESGGAVPEPGGGGIPIETSRNVQGDEGQTGKEVRSSELGVRSETEGRPRSGGTVETLTPAPVNFIKKNGELFVAKPEEKAQAEAHAKEAADLGIVFKGLQPDGSALFGDPQTGKIFKAMPGKVEEELKAVRSSEFGVRSKTEEKEPTTISGIKTGLGEASETQDIGVAPSIANQQSTIINKKAHEAATSPKNELPEPTPAQKEAGNYQKGHVNLQGLDISIENPKGSVRSGVSRNGAKWSTTMQQHYGYIKGTVGRDKDHIDTFIGDHPESDQVFVINQVNPDTGKFDEHKVMLGFNSEQEAREAYQANYQKGWKGLGSMVPMIMDEFKTWLKEGDTKKEVRSSELGVQPERPERPNEPEAPGSTISVENQGKEEKKAEIPKEERRKNLERRKKIEELTPEEMRRELLVDHLTGLPNKRAYDEAGPRAVQVMMDVDGLKWINDNFSHQTGDELLKEVGKALADQFDDKSSSFAAYHVSGDEFIIQGDDQAEIDRRLARVSEALKGITLKYTAPDGTVQEMKGIGLSYGTGENLEQAERRLQENKKQRETLGERARRGERPPGVAEIPAQGGEAGNQEGALKPQEGPQAAPEPKAIETPAPAVASADLGRVANRSSKAEAAKEPVAANPVMVLGKETEVSTPKTPKIPVQYALADIKDLVTSHDNALNINMDYPQELQPRNRTRLASEEQIGRIVNKLDPALLGENPMAQYGAPIVTDAGVVISGNARTIALKRILEGGPGSGVGGQEKAYREWLTANAEKFGIDPKDITNNSVLIRINRSKMDLAKLAREANEEAIAAMSPSEQAMNDAGKLTAAHLDHFAPSDDGNLLAAPNREFIRLFIRDVVSPNEVNALTTSGGELSQAGVNRIRNAVFAKAFGDAETLERLAESTDNNVRNITGGMVAGAGKLMKVKTGIEEGRFYPVDIARDVVSAMKKLSEIRNKGITYEDYLKQGELFDTMTPEAKSLLGMLSQYSRSAKKVGEFLNLYADMVRGSQKPDKNQASLFNDLGPKAEPTKAEMITAAKRKMEALYGPEKATAQFNIFAERQRAYGQTDTGELPAVRQQGQAGEIATVGSADSGGGAARAPGAEKGRFIKGPRVEYYVRENTGPETEITQKYSVRPSRGTVSGGGSRTLAKGITTEFKQKGWIDLRGKTIRGPQDLADLAQIYRDPQVETFRIIYLQGDKIVGHEGMTSNAPGFVLAFPEVSNRGKKKEFYQVKDRMARLSADGYYLLHNHPSGKSTPSPADAAMTHEFATAVQGFKGHVIIDSNEFSWIDDNLWGHTEPIKTDNRMLTPEIQHGLLGITVSNAPKVAKVALQLKAAKGFATVLFLDSNLNVRAIQEVPFGLLNNIKEATDYLRGRLREFGAGGLTISLPVGQEKSQNIAKLVDNGIAFDVVHYREDGAWYSRKEALERAGINIKAATENEWMGRPIRRKMAGEEMPDFQTQGPKPRVPIFYSKMARFLEAKLPNSGLPLQWKSMVENWAKKGEFKAEELKWSGLSPWLAEQKGKITKAEVAEFLRENQIEVREKIKGSQEQYPEELITPSMSEAQKKSDWASFWNEYSELPPIQRFRIDEWVRDNTDDTKFDQWQTPGGKYYRELLLMLPETKTPAANAVDEFVSRMKLKYGDESQGASYKWINKLTKEEEAERVRLQTELREEPKNLPFKSSHWTEPNVMAHVRFNDRTDAEGKKVLFLEEIQSDWAREGRKKGFAGNREGWEVRNVGGVNPWQAFYKNEPMRLNGPTQKTVWGLIDTEGVPAMPFAKNWEQVVLKRMLRYAAENGYDKLAWINGEETEGRYNLRKYIDSVEYWAMPNGEYGFTAYKDGKIANKENNLSPQQLENYIGKETARKIINRENPTNKVGETQYGELSGLDLEIKADWAYNLYDRMIPQFLNKYGKQWGTRVEETSLKTEEEKDFGHYNYESDGRGGWNVYNLDTNKIIRRGLKSIEEVKKFISGEIGSQNFQSLPITPSMKESVLTQGQPLFNIQGTRRAASLVGLEDVQRAFKGQEVTQTDGGYRIRTNGNQFIEIREVDHINDELVAFETAYGRQRADDEVIAGSYKKGRIKLVRGMANQWVLSHESVHFMEDAGIITPGESALLENHIKGLVKQGKFETANKAKIGGQEDRANFIADQLTNPDPQAKGFIQKIVAKIREFVDRLVNAFGGRTVRGIVRDVETGKVFEREGFGEYGKTVRSSEFGVRSENPEEGLTEGEQEDKIEAMSLKKGPGDIPPKENPMPEGGNWRDTSKWDIPDFKAEEMPKPSKESDSMLDGLFQKESPDEFAKTSIARQRRNFERERIENYQPPVKGKFLTQENIDEISKAILAWKEGKLRGPDVDEIIYKNLPLPPAEEHGSGMMGDVYGGTIKDNLAYYLAEYLKGRGIQRFGLDGKPDVWPKMPWKEFRETEVAEGRGYIKKGELNKGGGRLFKTEEDAKDFWEKYRTGKPVTLDDNAPIPGSGYSREHPEIFDEIIKGYRDNPTKILRDIFSDIKERIGEDEAAIKEFMGYYGPEGEFNPDAIARRNAEEIEKRRKSLHVVKKGPEGELVYQEETKIFIGDNGHEYKGLDASDSLSLLSDQEFKDFTGTSKEAFSQKGGSIYFIPASESVANSIHHISGEILLSDSLKNNNKELRSTLIHELTHWGQIESGETPKSYYVSPEESIRGFMEYFSDPAEVKARANAEGWSIKQYDEFMDALNWAKSDEARKFKMPDIGEIRIENKKTQRMPLSYVQAEIEIAKKDLSLPRSQRAFKDIENRQLRENIKELESIFGNNEAGTEIAKAEDINNKLTALYNVKPKSDTDVSNINMLYREIKREWINRRLGIRNRKLSESEIEKYEVPEMRIEVLGKIDPKTGKREHINPIMIESYLREKTGIRGLAVGPNEIDIELDEQNLKNINKLSKIIKKVKSLPNRSIPPGEGGEVVSPTTPEEFSAKEKEQYSILKSRTDLDQAKVDTEISNYDKFSFQDSMANIKDMARNWGKAQKPGRPDTSILGRFFGSPEFTFEKVPALKKVVTYNLERADLRVGKFNDLISDPAGRDLQVGLRTLQKERPAEYERLGKLLVRADQNKRVYNADLIKKMGFSDQAVAAWQDARAIMDNGFDLQIANWQEMVRKAKEAGLPMPTIVILDEKGHPREVSVQTAIAQMGEMRAWYWPRLRESGGYMIVARATEAMKAKGIHNRLEFKDFFVEDRVAELRRQGYQVEYSKSKSVPEDLFSTYGKVMGTEQMINEALNRSLQAVGNKSNFQFSDMGIKAMWSTSVDDKPDFIVDTKKVPQEQLAKIMPIIKALGGKWYSSAKGEPKYWHFVGANKTLENKLRRALSRYDNRLLAVEEEFARALTTNVANIEKGRGYRSSMIQRGPEVGTDVWEGYEQDPLRAMTSYASRLAGGESKKETALKMIRAFNGTEKSWAQFKAENEEAEYEDYMKYVESQRVSPTEQKNAYHDGLTYIQEALRNPEMADRVVGVAKGLANFKYLGFRVAAPIVNMTALITSVPAAMNGYAGIPLASTFKWLGKGADLWRQYRHPETWSTLPADIQAAFKIIQHKGWADSQYNREAMAVLKSKAGRGWNRAMDASMWMFGQTEQLNRVATLMGTFEALREAQGAGLKAQGKTLTEAQQAEVEKMMETAKKVSDRAHGVYGPATIPAVAQGKGPAGMIIKSLYMFKKFQHNYLQTMYELGWKQKNWQAATFMMAAPTLLAGAGAFPIPWAWEAMMGILKHLLGIDDPEEKIYSSMEKTFGDYVGGISRQGLAGLGGRLLDLRASLGAGKIDIPTNMVELLGAPGSVLSDVYLGGANILKGNVWKGTERVMPRVIGTAMQSYREATEGVTTKTNAPVFFGREQIKENFLDAALKSLSFNPARIQRMKDIEWSEKQVWQDYKERRALIESRFLKYYLQPPENRDKTTMIGLVDQVKEYNERVRSHGLIGVEPIITSDSIRTYIMRNFKPSKKELVKGLKREG